MGHPSSVPPPGDASRPFIERLTAEFATCEDGNRWGVYQTLDNGSPTAIVANWLERTTLFDSHDEDEDLLERWYGPYSKQSVWTVFVHHPTCQPVAATRSIVGPIETTRISADLRDVWGLSWAEACAAADVDPNLRFVENASISVLNEWSTTDNLWPVKMSLAFFFHLLQDLEADYAVQVISPAVTRVFGRWGVPFLPMAEPLPVDGEPYRPGLFPVSTDLAWFRSIDNDFGALMRCRDTSVRGGIAVPSPDEQSIAVVLDAELRRRGTTKPPDDSGS